MSKPTSQITASRVEAGMRLALIGILVNALLAVAKLLAGYFGDSYALIADGIESTLDIAGSCIIWSGLKLATKPPDAEHPYGHGKAEPIASIVVALSVIGAALGLMFQSVREILTPHHPPQAYTLIVLVVVVIIKESLFRIVSRLGKKAQSTAIKTDAGHHRADAITSGAAFIGISIALIGGKGYEPADDWAALFACVIIAYNGFTLFKPAINEVMDTAPPKEIEQKVREVTKAVPGVIDIDQCRVRKMGLEFYVDLHVGVDGNISVRAGHKISHDVKDAVRQSGLSIADVLVHIEPVIGNVRGRATFAER